MSHAAPSGAWLSFFKNLAAPLDKQGVGGVQTAVYRLLGALCMVYGGFILLLVAIPNRLNGRLAFLFCGGAMFGVGSVLSTIGKRKAKQTGVPAAIVSALK